MKVIELFAGIGAPRMVLNELGIKHETIGISEIDNNAIKIYNTIHGETYNFGDIRQIDSLPYCDFIHCSSPCQSFSQAGKKEGIKGKSGLIYEFYRLMDNYSARNELPKYISFENVPNLKTKFIDVFQDFIYRLENWGYNVYNEILNANYFDCVSKRERLFIIGIRKDIDNGKFSMPKNDKNNFINKRLKDYLSTEVDEKFYWPHEVKFHKLKDDEERIDTTRKIGWLETACGKETQSNRVWSKNGLCPTITCSMQALIKEDNGRFRKLTPEEYWKIMQFSKEDYLKIKDKFSKSAITKVCGNSIALGPLKAIYNNLFKSQD